MAYKMVVKPVPGKRGQGPSGNFVGTGVNRKTAARPEYKAGVAQKNDNGQIDQWIDQAPEPFRNSQSSANPRIGYGKGSGHYTPRGGIQGSPPPSQSQINLATGHRAGYEMAGKHSVISGHPTNAPKRNTDNGSQPPSRFSTNKDIFNDKTEAMLKRWGYN